jgi:hypothetical protein
MKVALARAPVRLGASTCPLAAVGCDCTGPCPLSAAPVTRRRLVRSANPAALGGFLDTITGALSSAYEAVTSIPSDIADVISSPASAGDYTNTTFAGSKYPTSSIFTPAFAGLRTQNSLQGLANDIASGIALPRDDGSVASRDNKSTIAPAGSVYVSFFQAKGVQILSSAAAPAISQPATPSVLNDILSGVSFGILGGQDSASPAVTIGAVSPATSGVQPTTGPAWVTVDFLNVATQARLDRIVADLKSGAMIVLNDGSIVAPLASGNYSIMAPAGSVNPTLYQAQTGKAVAAAKATAAAPATGGIMGTIEGIFKTAGGVFSSTATSALNLTAAQQLAKLQPAVAPVVTPAQQAAQAQVAQLQAQLAAQQQQAAALAAQQAAAATAAQQQQILAQQQAAALRIQQLQDQLNAATNAVTQAQAAGGAAAVAAPLISSGLMSPGIIVPYSTPAASSVSTPDFSSALASLMSPSAVPAAAAPALAVSAPSGINWNIVILAAGVLGIGAMFLLRRRGGAASRGRAYSSRPVRRTFRRRRRAYA